LSDSIGPNGAGKPNPQAACRDSPLWISVPHICDICLSVYHGSSAYISHSASWYIQSILACLGDYIRLKCVTINKYLKQISQ